jgi:hypothetical protein
MKERAKYQRECLCCGERFETTRTDKFYVNNLHQKKANDIHQEKKRKILQKLCKPMNDTYQIYKKLMGEKNEVRVSKEFLRGRGANLKYFNHVIKIDNKLINALFDIAIIDEGDFFNLKKIRQ